MQPIATEFYAWQNYRCAWEVHYPTAPTAASGIPLLLIHPIGVGLSGQFWHRFCSQWYHQGSRNPIYNPDLLGCGQSDMPRLAYYPTDWAAQLQHFLQTVIQKPVIVVVQGALLPVAIALTQCQANLIRGLVFAGPPGWPIMTKKSSHWQQRLVWNLFFDSPLGNAFYRYARRRQFLESFSIRQLFADVSGVDSSWLDALETGAENPASRYAVFSFLAGFWRQDYERAIAAISQPTLVVVGERASNISPEGKRETPDRRIAAYLECLPNGRGVKITGRNVLPYESTAEFVRAIAPFVAEFN